MNSQLEVDRYIATFRQCLIQTEAFLEKCTPPLDGLIELSGTLRIIEGHLRQLRLDHPGDHRLALLVARCEENHEEVIARADEAARQERFATGASIH